MNKESDRESILRNQGDGFQDYTDFVGFWYVFRQTCEKQVGRSHSSSTSFVEQKYSGAFEL